MNGPCLHGTCTDNGAGVFKCTCATGWADSNCDWDVDECEETFGSNRCSSHATCTNTAGSHECVCDDGYSGNGINCIDEPGCDNASGQTQCGVHGSCQSTGQGTYRCICHEGWRDFLCDQARGTL